MHPPKAEYEVERILAHKYVRGKAFYFIKWRGFGIEENSWEPEENLSNCLRVLRAYFASGGLSNMKSPKISSTPERKTKATTGRNPRLARAWRKSSAQLKAAKGSSKASTNSGARGDISKDRHQYAVRSQVAEDSPKSSLVLANRIPSMDSQEANVDLQALKKRRFSLDLPAENVSKGPRRYSLDMRTKESPNAFQRSSIELPAAQVDDLPTAEAQNSQPHISSWYSAAGSGQQLAEGSKLETNSFAATPSQASVDSKIDRSQDLSGMATAGQTSDSGCKEDKQLSGLGLTLVWPKIEIQKFDLDSSFQQQLGLVVAQRPLAESNVPQRVGQRGRRPTPYSKTSASPSKVTKRVRRQRYPVVDLTTESLTSTDEAFSSSQLSDNDRSWRNSTAVGHKFHNKLQVRLFDQTPRPEVLTTVPFLDTSESEESASEYVANSSDKENLPKKRRGRPPLKRRRSRPTTKPSGNCSKGVKASATSRPKLPAAEVPAEDLPKTTDALVLLTEQNAAGQSNVMMYFRRLNLVKSIPQQMADKYYSQAVIDYYRRSMQPQPKVSRRSL